VHLAASGSETAVSAGARGDDLSAVYSHSLFTTADGKLWAMGYNYYGQLGTGDTTRRTTPEQVATSGSVTAVATGYYHTLFTTADGKLWAMGYNSYGQLGTGDTTNRSTPMQIFPPPLPAGWVAGAGSQTRQAGETATFSAVTSAVTGWGASMFTFSWQKNGVPIAGATSASYTTPVLTLADNGSLYTVTVANHFSDAVTLSAALAVTPTHTAPAIATGGDLSAITHAYGGAATLAVAATGYPAPAFQWETSADGTTWTLLADSVTTDAGGAVTASVAGTRTATLTLTGRTPENDGTQYRLRITNTTTSFAGTVTTTTIHSAATMLFVSTAPAPAFNISKTILALAAPANSAGTFAVTGQIPWLARADAGAAGWLALTPAAGGAGAATVTARALSQNNTGALRAATIAIIGTGTGAGIARSVFVTQNAAAGAGTAAPAALPDGATLAFTAAGGAAQLSETYIAGTGAGGAKTLTPADAAGTATGAPLAYEYTATGDTATLILYDAAGGATVWSLNFPARTFLLYDTTSAGAPYELAGTLDYTTPAAATATVTFNINAAGDATATVSPAGKTVTAGAAYGPLPAATRNGYTFAGWFTAGGGGVQVTETTPVAAPAANHTLYAPTGLLSRPWTSGSPRPPPTTHSTRTGRPPAVAPAAAMAAEILAAEAAAAAVAARHRRRRSHCSRRCWRRARCLRRARGAEGSGGILPTFGIWRRLEAPPPLCRRGRRLCARFFSLFSAKPSLPVEDGVPLNLNSAVNGHKEAQEAQR
jgi:uncharacterized repeat protein (TIGR02543 family)